ncbi:MAG: hypothetical protein M9896_03285 [Candidatus Promineofilum sp.]|uniref:hypothetical protein n=1 Tax=Promineifilum sp. TaxID=2664178 RepID=UPI002411F89E|nr:hypothetical protein [Promineifilum sp.]
MSKRFSIFSSLLIACLLLTATARLSPLRAYDPSFPTRTPTPDGNSQPPIPTSDPGNPGNPPPTDTLPPGATAPAQTATVTPPGAGALPPVAPTVLGGTLRANSGLGECSDTPYVRALDRLIVYGGPGINFGPVTTLEAEEMRPITGRAGFATWWQIQVKADTLGWVTDAEVDEFGNTALVPIVAPPTINGATPTPGSAWNPTPLPLLTCVPTPTPSATPTHTPTPTGISGAAPGTDNDNGGPAATADAADMVSADILATPVQAAQPQTSSANAENAPDTGLTSRGSDASRTASPTNVTNLILPLLGLALIAGGIILALLSRNRGGPETE